MSTSQTIKYLAIAGLGAVVVIVLVFWFNVLVLGRFDIDNDRCEATGITLPLDPDCETKQPLPSDE